MRIIRTVVIFIVVLAIGLTALHFWLQSNARKVLATFIHDQSNGTLAFHAKKVSINYFQKRVTFENILFVSTRKDDGATKYAVSCPTLILELKRLRPLFTEKKYYIEKLLFESPRVVITKYEEDSSKVRVSKEWGTIYQALQKTLSLVYLETFRINNATVCIIPTKSSGDKPLIIDQTYLEIDQFLADNQRTKKPVIQAKRINLTIYDQQIFFPNKGHFLSFKKLNFNTEKGLVLLEKYALIKPPVDSQSYYRIDADTLRIGNLQFEKFYEEGDMHAGSIYFGNPAIRLHLNVKGKQVQGPKKSIREIFASLSGALQVDTLQLRDAAAFITTQQGNKTNELKVQNVDLYADKLKSQVTNVNGEPVSFGKIKIGIQNYSAMLADSAYLLEIGNINYRDTIFRFENILLSPVDPTNKNASTISLDAMELDNLSIVDLLFHRRLVADRLLLDGPNLDLTAPKKTGNPTKKRNLVSTQELLDSVFQVKQLQIRKGNIEVESKKGYFVRAHDLSLDANINNTLQISDPDAIINQVQRLTFKDLDIKTKAVKVRVDGTSMQRNQVEFANLYFETADGLIKGNLQKLRTAPSFGELKGDTLEINGLGWAKGDIYIQLDSSKHQEQKKKEKLDILIKKIAAKNTNLHIQHPQWKASTTLAYLNTNALKLSQNQKPNLGLVEYLLNDLRFSHQEQEVLAQAWRYQTNHKHEITQLHVKNSDHDTVSIDIPLTTITLPVQQLLKNQFAVQAVQFNQPKIEFAQNPTKKIQTANKPASQNPIEILQGKLKKAQIHATLRDSVQTKQVRMQDANLSWNRLQHGVNGTMLEGIQIESPNASFQQKKRTIWKGSFAIDIPSVSLHDSVLIASIQQIKASGNQAPDFKLNDSLASVIRFQDASLGPIEINKHGKLAISSWIHQNRHAQLNIRGLAFENDHIAVKAATVSSPALSTSIQFQQFQFQPKDSPLLYMSKQIWQTDYIGVQASNLSINHVRVPETDITDLIHVGEITLTEPSIYIYRDKTLPFQHGIHKPLPTVAIQKIKQGLQIDSIRIMNGDLTYQEKSDKTELTGTVTLNKIEGKISHIKNTNLKATDSLWLSARALLMNQAPLRMRMRQSYLDSLSAFTFLVTLGSTPLSILNRITEPAVSVQILSGQLDTLSLHAIGREHLSLGYVDMPYRNLKVKFLKKGDKYKKDFLSGLITFAANSFVIKKNNRARRGVVYFPRNTEKSIFNYMVKMTLSGAASSAGAKSNKKYMKQYQKAIKSKQLPPIATDDL
jgi:hypothetical protein